MLIMDVAKPVPQGQGEQEEQFRWLVDSGCRGWAIYPVQPLQSAPRNGGGGGLGPSRGAD